MESVGRDNVSNSSIVTPPLHDLFSMKDLPRSELLKWEWRLSKQWRSVQLAG